MIILQFKLIIFRRISYRCQFLREPAFLHQHFSPYISTLQYPSPIHVIYAIYAISEDLDCIIWGSYSIAIYSNPHLRAKQASILMKTLGSQLASFSSKIKA